MVFADEFSVSRRLLFVAIGVFGTFICSGVVFGFQGLRPSLINSGVYSELCERDEDQPCNAQILRLNLLFAVASSITNISFFPLGIYLDKYGPKTTALTGCIIFFIGKILFYFGSESFDGFLWGYGLLAFGGAAIYLSSMNLALVFPSNSGLIMAAITGSFDASSLVYVIVDYIRSLFPSPQPHIRYFFLIYAIVPLVYGLLVALVMPKTSFLKAEISSAGSSSENESLLSSNNLAEYGTDTEDLKKKKGGVDVDSLVLKQLRSALFWGLAFTMLVYMLSLNTHISTLREQLVDRLDNNETNIINLLNFFNIALPVGGIIAIPIVGPILDNLTPSSSFFLLWATAVAFAVTNLIPVVLLQYLAIVIFVVLRPFVYTAGNDFAATSFGFLTFGRVYGLLSMMAGVFNLVQYPLAYLAVDILDGHFLVSNLILLGMILAVVVFPSYLAIAKIGRGEGDKTAEEVMI